MAQASPHGPADRLQGLDGSDSRNLATSAEVLAARGARVWGEPHARFDAAAGGNLDQLAMPRGPRSLPPTYDPATRPLLLL